VVGHIVKLKDSPRVRQNLFWANGNGLQKLKNRKQSNAGEYWEMRPSPYLQGGRHVEGDFHS